MAIKYTSNNIIHKLYVDYKKHACQYKLTCIYYSDIGTHTTHILYLRTLRYWMLN